MTEHKEETDKPYQKTPLEDALEKLVKSYRENPEDKPKHLIYHYTKISALAGILESKSFWMTDYRYLNDPSEFSYSSAIIKTCLDKFSGGAAFSDIRKHLESLLGYDLQGPCIVSFSADPDSLYQWRAYGDDGNGVSIGIAPPERDIRNLAPVIYDKKGQSDFLEQFLCKFVDTCNLHPSDALHPLTKAQHLYMLLVGLKARFKHSAYSIEKEWRYVNFPLISCMKVREGRKGPVAYFPASILDGTSFLPIKDIRLGPNQDEMKGKHVIKVLFTQYKCDPDKVQISKSEIPNQST